jgi:hypothetical protein
MDFCEYNFYLGTSRLWASFYVTNYKEDRITKHQAKKNGSGGGSKYFETKN